jgi:hypothetical protein
MRRATLAILALVALGAAACSGGGKGIDVKWESDSSRVVLGDGGRNAGSSVETVVYIEVNGGSVVRDAVVRLNENDFQGAIGLSIGTNTAVPTTFRDGGRAWSLGDLEPGKRYGLRIGLWFASQYAEAVPEKLLLSVEVSSPDLPAPVRSNDLALTVARAR